MISVFKLQLPVRDEQEVELQEGSRILKVGEQNGVITLWYICPAEAELAKETFYVVGTGQQLPDTFPGQYVGSVQVYHPADDDILDNPTELVWHVFFKQKPSVKRGKTIQQDPNDPAADTGAK